ncbi:MAG TPA: NADH-quinone oxidoreductase subunit C [Caulobacteraceae bacterium]|nr:NADH-quinone oxidoreductase subunit C [Caulobacteraceae bacterium]
MTWPTSQADLAALGERIVADAPGAAIGFSLAYGELTVTAETERVVELLTLLRDSPAFAFQQLIDLCGADYPQRSRRFDIVYHLLSLTRNVRIRVKVETDEATPVPSAAGVWPAAGWFEREAFDMYGVFFEGHPDLRRILTDYGFEGFPLRKDFPMTGHVELRYDDERKAVVYEPVKAVEFRNWDFLSPWEGAPYAKPGQGYPYELPGEDGVKKA